MVIGDKDNAKENIKAEWGEEWKKTGSDPRSKITYDVTPKNILLKMLDHTTTSASYIKQVYDMNQKFKHELLFNSPEDYEHFIVPKEKKE